MFSVPNIPHIPNGNHYKNHYKTLADTRTKKGRRVAFNDVSLVSRLPAGDAWTGIACQHHPPHEEVSRFPAVNQPVVAESGLPWAGSADQSAVVMLPLTWK